jgi:hypothetical protein
MSFQSLAKQQQEAYFSIGDEDSDLYLSTGYSTMIFLLKTKSLGPKHCQHLESDAEIGP